MDTYIHIIMVSKVVDVLDLDSGFVVLSVRAKTY